MKKKQPAEVIEVFNEWPDSDRGDARSGPYSDVYLVTNMIRCRVAWKRQGPEPRTRALHTSRSENGELIKLV